MKPSAAPVPPPAANPRKNGPPTPRGRKRPLRWDGTPSLSATPCERFTENRQLHRRLRHLLLRDRGRGAGCQAAVDGAANGYARPAPPRQTSTPLPTGQKIFKVRGLDSPIARAVVLGHSRTGMYWDGDGIWSSVPSAPLLRVGREASDSTEAAHLLSHLLSCLPVSRMNTQALRATVWQSGYEPRSDGFPAARDSGRAQKKD